MPTEAPPNVTYAQTLAIPDGTQDAVVKFLKDNHVATSAMVTGTSCTHTAAVAAGKDGDWDCSDTDQ
jgi:hypothetical protein